MTHKSTPTINATPTTTAKDKTDRANKTKEAKTKVKRKGEAKARVKKDPKSMQTDHLKQHAITTTNMARERGSA